MFLFLFLHVLLLDVLCERERVKLRRVKLLSRECKGHDILTTRVQHAFERKRELDQRQAQMQPEWSDSEEEMLSFLFLSNFFTWSSDETDS